MSQIDPLQDALESLHWQWLNMNGVLSRQLRTDAPNFVAAVERVTALGQSAHVPPPPLQEGDVTPDRLHDALLYVDEEDLIPPRHLSDVWQGRGDHDDPFAPVDLEQGERDTTNWAAVEHDQDLLAKRMRADSDATLKQG